MRAFELTFKGINQAVKVKSMKQTVRALTPQLAREMGEVAIKKLPVHLVSVVEVPTIPSSASLNKLVTFAKKVKHKEPKQANPLSVAGLCA